MEKKISKVLTNLLVLVVVAGFFASVVLGAKYVTAAFMFAMPIAFFAWGGARNI